MNIEDNNELQIPQVGIPQQLNARVMRNLRNSNQGTYTRTDSDFAGLTPEIGGVLTLPAEIYIDKRVGYTKFQDFNELFSEEFQGIDGSGKCD